MRADIEQIRFEALYLCVVLLWCSDKQRKQVGLIVVGGGHFIKANLATFRTRRQL